MNKPVYCIIVDDEPVAREILENYLLTSSPSVNEGDSMASTKP